MLTKIWLIITTRIWRIGYYIARVRIDIHVFVEISWSEHFPLPSSYSISHIYNKQITTTSAVTARLSTAPPLIPRSVSSESRALVAHRTIPPILFESTSSHPSCRPQKSAVYPAETCCTFIIQKWAQSWRDVCPLSAFSAFHCWPKLHPRCAIFKSGSFGFFFECCVTKRQCSVVER